MKSSRRRFEELAWVLGLHGTVVTLYRSVGNRANASALKNFYASFVPPTSLVFDIGANVGQYAEALEAIGCTVVAVEPNSDCVRHIELTYPGKKIEVLHAATGPKDGLTSFNVSDTRDDTSTMSKEWMAMLEKEYRHNPGEWRRMTVPTVTLDTLISHYGLPFYIKIDVEGFEPFVLDGLSTQPSILSFECHGLLIDGALECVGKRVFSEDSGFNLTDDSGCRFVFADPVPQATIRKALEDLRGVQTYRDVYVLRG